MLKGTLDDFTLPDIFRLLSQSKKTGRLDVQRSAGHGSVFFRHGDVYFAESTLSRELIGQKLVKAKVVTDGQLMKALDEQAEADGRRIGEILRSAEVVTDAQLEAALRAQIEDAVFDLLRWDAGEFDWVPNEETNPEVSLSVSVENLIMEGSRRLDELAIITRKIPSEHAVVAMAPAPPEGAAEINITPVEWRVLVLVNGQRTVLDISHEVGSDVFATMRTLYGLAAAGLIHVPGHVDVEDEPLPELPPERPILDVAESEAADSVDPVTPDEEVSAAEPEAVADVVAADHDVPDAEAAYDVPALEEVNPPAADVATDAAATSEEQDEPSGVGGEPTGYHAGAYNPEFAAEADEPEFAAEAGEPEAQPDTDSEEAEPVAASTETAAADHEPIEATDLPTSDWFDAPQPGDVTASTPSDPFADEILAPHAPHAADISSDAYETSVEEPEAETPVASAPVDDEDEHVVDKRAAVQELSALFKQNEVEDGGRPTFLVPPLESESENTDEESNGPETKHRVEDDEEITRGLISRLIDGVKGL